MSSTRTVPQAADVTVDVLVIGAGPTGIGAAVRLTELGIDHLVVDPHDVPGGMARSIRDDHGFTWDLGGHVIHSHFPSFDKAVAASGTPMLGVRRNGVVWTNGRLVPMPIQQHLDELPNDLRPDAPAANLAEHFRNQFGSKLAAEFFEPHIRKMWAHPVDRVAHEWTSLRAGSGARNVPSLGLAADRIPVEAEVFPYPEGGTGALWISIAAALTEADRFRFGTSVAHVDGAARRAVLDDGTTVAFGECVSAAPLTTALRWAGLDLETLPGADRLAVSTVHAVGFGLRGEPPAELADKTYLASPDADVPWYRASVLSNYDPANAGPGRWNVLCETTTSDTGPISLDTAVEGSLASLCRLGLDPTAIESTWTATLPMGYPVPTVGRDDVVRELDEALRGVGIRSRGRFGGWRYESCNQDYTWEQGRQAVDSIVDGSPEDVYWHPERF